MKFLCRAVVEGKRRRSAPPRFAISAIAAAAATTVLLAAAPASAQDTNWASQGGDTEYTNEANWPEGSPFNPPAPGGWAVINDAGTTSPVWNGDVEDDVESLPTAVGLGAGRSGLLTVNTNDESMRWEVNPEANSTNTPRMGKLDGYNVGSPTFVVGAEGGTGRLDVNVGADPGNLLSLGKLGIGMGPGSSGTVNVLGTGKPAAPEDTGEWMRGVQTATTVVGYGGGNGVLNVNGVGFMATANPTGGPTSLVAFDPASTDPIPALVVGSGAGSTGTVNVLAGGKLVTDFQLHTNAHDLTFIGDAGGTGTLNVSGASTDGLPSRAHLWGETTVGRGAGSVGNLNISDGGYVAAVTNRSIEGLASPSTTAQAPQLRLGVDGGSGNAVVSGAGSALYVSGSPQEVIGSTPLFPGLTQGQIGQLVVGDSGTGSLTVADGGNVMVGRLSVDLISNNLLFGQDDPNAGSVTTSSYELPIGAITVGAQAGSVGALNIGAPAGQAPAAPGTVQAGQIQFGAGDGHVVLNHTDTSGNYQFTTPLVGPGTLENRAGTTWLQPAQDLALQYVTGYGTDADGNPDPTQLQYAPLVLPTTNAGFSGTTALYGGTLGLGYNEALGTSAVNVHGNAALAYANGVDIANPIAIDGGATLEVQAADGVNAVQRGPISGAGNLDKTGAGTLNLASDNPFTGATTVTGGTLGLTEAGSLAASSGVNVAGGATFDVTGVAALDTSIKTLSGDGTVALGDTNLNLTAAQDTFGGQFTGSASSGLTLQAGREILTGTSPDFLGATSVRGGELVVNGSILNSPTTVFGGGTLSGTGTVGALVAQSGAIVSPGNSGIGTLSVNGNYTAQPGSIYRAEYGNPGNPGQSDLLNVNGTVTIQPGAQLQATPASGSELAQVNTRYHVVGATGGVSGTYTLGGNANPSPYISLRDEYDANNVYLSVRGSLSNPVLPIAYTPNQAATVTGASVLPDTNPMVLGLLWSATPAIAQANLDQLSGEIHASLLGSAINSSFGMREGALDRLRGSQCAPGARSLVNSQGADGRCRRILACEPEKGLVAWGRIQGTDGRTRADGNAARVDHSSMSVLLGVDSDIAGSDWRVGGFAGFERLKTDVPDRQSRATTESYTLGAYGGTRWGNTGLRLGASYSMGNAKTQRDIVMLGYTDSTHAKYNLNTLQVFGELGQRIDLSERASIEPFVGLSYVRVSRDAFSERGFYGALNGADQTLDATYGTLGVRGQWELSGDTRLRGTLGVRSAFGRQTPTSTQWFTGGLPFTVSAPALARNVALVELGVDTRLSQNATFGASYVGQFGGGYRDHGIRLDLSWKF